MPDNLLWNDFTNGLFTAETVEIVRKPTGVQDQFLNKIPVFPSTWAWDAQRAHYYPVQPAEIEGRGEYVPALPGTACAWPEACGNWFEESFITGVPSSQPFECSIGEIDMRDLIRRWVHDGQLSLSDGEHALQYVQKNGVLPPDMLLRRVSAAVETMALQMGKHIRWGEAAAGEQRLTGIYRLMQTAPIGEWRRYDSTTDAVTAASNQMMPSLAATVVDWATLAANRASANTDCGETFVHVNSRLSDDTNNQMGNDFIDLLARNVRRIRAMAQSMSLMGTRIIAPTNLQMALHVSSRSVIRALQEMAAMRVSAILDMNHLQPADLNVVYDFGRIDQRLAGMTAPGGMTSVDGQDYGSLWLDPAGNIRIPIFYDPGLREAGNTYCFMDADEDGIQHDTPLVIGDVALITWGMNGNPAFGIVAEPRGESLNRSLAYLQGLGAGLFSQGMFKAPVPDAFIADAINFPQQWFSDDSYWLVGVQQNQWCMDVALRADVYTDAVMRWGNVFFTNVGAPGSEDDDATYGAFPLPSVDAMGVV